MSDASRRLLVLNPNGSAATTQTMVDIVVEAAPSLRVDGWTNAGAPDVIVDMAGLVAAEALLTFRLGESAFEAADAILVAAFADTCRYALSARHDKPVVGIAEAGMAAAAAGGRRFAVVTTTPGLVDAIGKLARTYGHSDVFTGVELTPGNPRDVMADPDRLLAALDDACRAALRRLGAETLVIGGGPLAHAARALAGKLPVPLIEPLPEAARCAIEALAQRTGKSRSPGSSHPS